MAQRRKIALLVEWSRAYGRRALRGIATHVKAHGTWKIHQTERRFSRLLGRTPKTEILRVQLDRVKYLLSKTDYPLAGIARLTRFDYVESMCYRFKRTVGQTPGQYRDTSCGNGIRE